MRKRAIVGVALGLVVGTGMVARAASENGKYVSVSCEAPRSVVVVDKSGKNFDIYAPGYPNDFVTNVWVASVSGWALVNSVAFPLILR